MTGLLLASLLFGLGLLGLLLRRNMLFMLMSIEVMLNAAGLAFVSAASLYGDPDGQIIFLFILAVAAAEVAVGLAMILLWYRQRGTLDADSASEMRG
jgi:NADH-quinone oxidoreductase subunit K